MARYEQLGEYEADENEAVAGVDRLQAFGHFATIVSLARKMGQTYQYISEMPADEVYMTLLLDMEVSQYEKRLSEIHRKTAQAK